MSDLKFSLPAVMQPDNSSELLKSISIDLSATKEGEIRLQESKMVNVATYPDLEYCFNCAYRELKRNYATVTFEIDKTQKKLDEVRAGIIIDKYPDFMKNKPAKLDTSDMRQSFISRDAEYGLILDRLNQLKMLEKLVEGKIKVFERACSFMRKQMDLVLRSGINSNLYNK